jgi:hypothetical protein
MRFYNQTHRFYCGVDLHARSMFVHVLDHEGQTRFEQDLPDCRVPSTTSRRRGSSSPHDSEIIEG